MYNIDGFNSYWGNKECNDQLEVVMDIATTILIDYCPQFPRVQETFEELDEWQQQCVNKAVFIQMNQVSNHLDYYLNDGANNVVKSQSVGRTSITYDETTATPINKLNQISRSMLDRAGICSQALCIYNGDGCDIC